MIYLLLVELAVLLLLLMAQTFVRASVAAIHDHLPSDGGAFTEESFHSNPASSVEIRFFPHQPLVLPRAPEPRAVVCSPSSVLSWITSLWPAPEPVRPPVFPLINKADCGWPPMEVTSGLVDWVARRDLPLLPLEGGGGSVVLAQTRFPYAPLRRLAMGEEAWSASQILADWASWYFADVASAGSLPAEDMLSLEAESVQSVIVE